MGGVPMRNDRRPVCRAAGRQQKQALAGLRAVLGRNGCGGRWFADPFWQTVPSTGSRRVLDAMMLERGRYSGREPVLAVRRREWNSTGRGGSEQLNDERGTLK